MFLNSRQRKTRRFFQVAVKIIYEKEKRPALRLFVDAMVLKNYKNMRNYSAQDVDAYIASSGKAARPTLKEIRKIIKSTIPRAEEGISWGVPFYKYHGLLGGFAAFKNHVSFGLAFVLESKDREKLLKKGYKTGSKTIQIKFDQKVPRTAIRQILKAKARLNDKVGQAKMNEAKRKN